MKELLVLFLKLGVTAFGGPAAHIAMMEDEVVRRRKWVSHEHFLDLLSATNLIPGPNSTEMAMHIGYVRAGWKGVCVAGLSFVLPAVVISLVLAHLYVVYGAIPQLEPIVAGVRPGIIAVILVAVFRLSKPVMRSRFAGGLGALVVLLNLLGVDEVMLLIGSGVLALLWFQRQRLNESLSAFMTLLPQAGSPAAGTTQFEAMNASLAGLGLYFLKIGSILYGSGYVLVAFLQSGLVDTRHWLTQNQLFDAVAVGQFTPGPVLSTATFIGYLILGIPGATVATVGIFLPSFVFVLISNPFIPKVRKSPMTAALLDGVNAASLGLMLAVTIKLALSALSSPVPWIIFLLASFVIVRWNVNAAWIVTASALLGWLLSHGW